MTPANPAAKPGEHQPSATPQSLWRRLVEGDLGSLRVLLVLAIIWTVFAVQNDRFLTATPEDIRVTTLEADDVQTLACFAQKDRIDFGLLG